MKRCARLTCLGVAMSLATACSSAHKQVDAADKAGQSWAATVKTVTDQWAQSRVSLRFTRTTLDTASVKLRQQAASVRAVDPALAARLDRLTTALGPVQQAVARNEPDHARALGALLPGIAK